MLMLVPLLASAQVDDGHGKEWLSVVATKGFSWNQVAQACPVGGTSHCTGMRGTTYVGTWVWATEAQVRTLYSYYVPALLTVPSVSGRDYFAPAVGFLDTYGATQRAASTYSSSGWGGGWTSPTDAGPVRGVYLWRQAGSGLPSGVAQSIVARDDNGSASPYSSGVAVANVLVNDTLGAAAATSTTVTLSQVQSTSSGLALNAANGSVNVAADTARGNYQLWYRICETALLANCAPAVVNVSVVPHLIDAVADYAKASSKTASTAAYLLGNDLLGTARAVPETVNLTLLTQPARGITVNLTTGAVSVAAKTSSGIYTFTYRLCEKADPLNCDSATATIELSGGL